MDDLFGDLVPITKKPEPAGSPASHTGVATNGSGAHGTAHGAAGSGLAAAGHRDELLDAFGSGPAASKGGGGGVTTLTLGREELSQLLSSTVEASVQSAFGKFAKSLRTVLEDMSKRIEEGSDATGELRGTLDGLREALGRQQEAANTRFTSVDVAVREVERGVQALRDKAELQDAQAQLAKMATRNSEPELKAVPPAQTPAPADAAPAASPPSASPAPTPAAAPAPNQFAPAATAVQPPQLAPFQQSPPPPAHLMQAPQLAPPPQARPPMAAPPQPQQQPQAPPQPHYQQAPQQQLPPPQMAPPPAYVSQSPSSAPGQPPAWHQAPSQPPQHQLPPQGSYGAPYPGSYVPPQGGPAYPTPSGGMPGYPGVPPLSNQHSGGSGAYGRPPPMGSGGPPPQRSAPPGAVPPASRTTSRAVPLEQIISDITNMGFERRHVMRLVDTMQRRGEAIDLNVIIDKLTRGDFD